MRLEASHAIGAPEWIADISWPDRERAHIEIAASSREAAEKYCKDIWGASITVVVTPKLR